MVTSSSFARSGRQPLEQMILQLLRMSDVDFILQADQKPRFVFILRDGHFSFPSAAPLPGTVSPGR